MTMLNSFRALWSGAAALVLLAAGPAALAQSTFELRYFMLDTFTPAVRFSSDDFFANGDPAAGLLYQTPSGPVAGRYASSTFTAGAERAGPASDFAGQHFGAGGLGFRYADAALYPSNLTPSSYESHALSLTTTVVPGSALGLVDSQKGFELGSLWNFTTPAVGESLLLGIGGSSAGVGSDGAVNYRDRLQLRFVTNLAGVPLLNFDLQTRQDGVFTRTVLESHALSSLPVDLSQVDYLYLQLWRDAPSAADLNPAVHATVYFMDAAYDAVNDNLVVLHQLDFAATGTSFLDDRFSIAYNAANWLAPIPEPANAALLLAGLAWLGLRARRR